MALFTIIEKAETLQNKIEKWIKQTKQSWNVNPILDLGPFYIEKREALSKLLREIFVMFFIIHHLGGVNALTYWNVFKWFNYIAIIHILVLGIRLEDFDFFSKVLQETK